MSYDVQFILPTLSVWYGFRRNYCLSPISGLCVEYNIYVLYLPLLFFRNDATRIAWIMIILFFLWSYRQPKTDIVFTTKKRDAIVRCLFQQFAFDTSIIGIKYALCSEILLKRVQMCLQKIKKKIYWIHLMEFTIKHPDEWQWHFQGNSLWTGIYLCLYGVVRSFMLRTFLTTVNFVI